MALLLHGSRDKRRKALPRTPLQPEPRSTLRVGTTLQRLARLCGLARHWSCCCGALLTLLQRAQAHRADPARRLWQLPRLPCRHEARRR